VVLCGSSQLAFRSSCTQLDASTGDTEADFEMPWDNTISLSFRGRGSGSEVSVSSGQRRGVLQVLGTFVVTGIYSATKTSTIAHCTLQSVSKIACTTKMFGNVMLLGSAWNAAVTKQISIGTYASYPHVMATDLQGNLLWGYVCIVSSMQTLSFNVVGIVPEFVGGFLAGSGVSSSSSAVVSLVAGWFHSDLGRMYYIMSMVPRNGAILNTRGAGLVSGIAVDPVALDTFVAGGILVGGTGLSVCAFVVRFNVLYKELGHGVHYAPLTAFTSADSSRAKAVLLVDSYLYVVCDVYDSRRNQTDLTVLKTDASTGGILQQVRITGPASISCKKVQRNGDMVAIACSLIQGVKKMPLVFSVTLELTFQSLLDGFERVTANPLQAFSLEFTASFPSVTQSTAAVSTRSGAFNSTSRTALQSVPPSRAPTAVPTRGPTGAPTIVRPTSQPSSQPSAQPSAHPSGSPTAAPSITLAPTAVPSTTAPTNTFRPSGEPSSQPSVSPTTQPVSLPTASPSVQRTGQPSTQPFSSPTSQPSAQPFTLPTQQPSSEPTRQPTTTPSIQPTALPSSIPSRLNETQSLVNEGTKSDSGLASYVIPLSCSIVGAAIVAFAVTYYRRVKSKKKEKSNVVPENGAGVGKSGDVEESSAAHWTSKNTRRNASGSPGGPGGLGGLGGPGGPRHVRDLEVGPAEQLPVDLAADARVGEDLESGGAREILTFAVLPDALVDSVVPVLGEGGLSEMQPVGDAGGGEVAPVVGGSGAEHSSVLQKSNSYIGVQGNTVEKKTAAPKRLVEYDKDDDFQSWRFSHMGSISSGSSSGSSSSISLSTMSSDSELATAVFPASGLNPPASKFASGLLTAVIATTATIPQATMGPEQIVPAPRSSTDQPPAVWDGFLDGVDMDEVFEDGASEWSM
jgi:hypothetical protein